MYALKKKNNSFGRLEVKTCETCDQTRALKKLLGSGLCREKGGGKEKERDRDCIIQFFFCFVSDHMMY